MPLTEKVEFKASLQRRNQFQVPKLIRSRHKLEPCQILKVTVSCLNIWNSKEEYLTQMGKDGRITIPKLTRSLLLCNQPNPQETYLIKVTLEPS